MEIDTKYRFGNIVFRVISPQAFKEDERFMAFTVDDSIKEDYTYEMCPLEYCEEANKRSSVQITRCGNYIKICMKSLLVPEITVANLFSAADTAKVLLEKNEFVLHVSYVFYNGEAILFCAPSGTGKSTQAELWRRARNSVTVNEDRAIIFRKDGKFYAGGCWATGKSRTCLNISSSIRQIVLLEQGTENIIKKLSSAEKFQKIISQCTFDANNEEQRDRIISNVFDLIESVPIIGYSCVKNVSSVEELERYL